MGVGDLELGLLTPVVDGFSEVDEELQGELCHSPHEQVAEIEHARLSLVGAPKHYILAFVDSSLVGRTHPRADPRHKGYE
jgi:hypothetical protein